MATTAMVTITPTTTAAVMVPTAMFAVPTLAAVTPIMAVMIAHREAPTIIIKDIIAVARIVIILVPAAAKTDVVKAISTVAGIIAVPRGIGIAIIIALVAIT
jgi:hypothetical protein